MSPDAPPPPPSQSLPEYPILPVAPSPVKPPPGPGPVIPRGFRISVILFFAAFSLLWISLFMGGLYHGTWLMMITLAIAAVVLAIGLGLTGSFIDCLASSRYAGRRSCTFFLRLALALSAPAAFACALKLSGYPVYLGLLCAAKWGIGLDNIRRLQTSPEVQRLAIAPRGSELEPVPEYLNSPFWGPAQVDIWPGTPAAPVAQLSWGGGFGYWGIVTGPPGEFPLGPGDYISIPWAKGVWVYIEG